MLESLTGEPWIYDWLDAARVALAESGKLQVSPVLRRDSPVAEFSGRVTRTCKAQ
jgi:hypothetical protein